MSMTLFSWCFCFLAILPLSHTFLPIQPAFDTWCPSSPTLPRCALCSSGRLLARTQRVRQAPKCSGVQMLVDPLVLGLSTIASTIFFIAYETRPSGHLEVGSCDVKTKQSGITGERSRRASNQIQVFTAAAPSRSKNHHIGFYILLECSWLNVTHLSAL